MVIFFLTIYGFTAMLVKRSGLCRIMSQCTIFLIYLCVSHKTTIKTIRWIQSLFDIRYKIVQNQYQLDRFSNGVKQNTDSHCFILNFYDLKKPKQTYFNDNSSFKRFCPKSCCLPFISLLLNMKKKNSNSDFKKRTTCYMARHSYLSTHMNSLYATECKRCV